MVQRLLGGKRDGANPDYERAAFERALEERFLVDRSERGHRHAHALRGSPAGVSEPAVDRLPARRAPSRRPVGARLRPAAVRPARRATRSSSSRAGARAATSSLLAFGYTLRAAARGRRARVGARPVRPARRLVRSTGPRRACSSARSCCRRSATRSAARPSRSASRWPPAPARAALYARVRRRAHVRDRALARAARRPRRCSSSSRRCASCCCPGDGAGERRRAGALGTPIVQIVLDELPETTLDRARRADRRRRCSRTSRASPRRHLVPQRHDGRRPDDRGGARRSSRASGREPGDLPTVRDHPRSLFTLFGRSHDLAVVEPITDVCPERLCARRGSGRSTGCEALRSRPDDRLRAPAAARRPARRAAADRPRVGGLRAPAAPPARPARRARTSSAASSTGSRATTRPPASSARSPRSTGRGSRPPLALRALDAAPRPVAVPARRAAVRHRTARPTRGSEEVWSGRQWLGRPGLPAPRAADAVRRPPGRPAAGQAAQRPGSTTARWSSSRPTTACPFAAGEPRRPVDGRQRAGHRARARCSSSAGPARAGGSTPRAVRTWTCCRRSPRPPACACRGGRTAGRRTSGPWTAGAPVDISHAGVPAITVPLATVLRGRRAHERDEARLLRAGVWAVGPRPGPRRPPRRGRARGARGGPRATVDAPAEYAAVDPAAAVRARLRDGPAGGRAGGRGARRRGQRAGGGDDARLSVRAPDAVRRDRAARVAAARRERRLGAPGAAGRAPAPARDDGRRRALSRRPAGGRLTSRRP